MQLELREPDEQVLIDIDWNSGDEVIVHYNTPDGNRPNDYGNQLYLWQAKHIPWGEPVHKQMPITLNDPDGDIVFSNLAMQDKDYIIGYSVGGEADTQSKYINVCTTARLPKNISSGTKKIEYFFSRILPLVESNDIFTVNYDFPYGFKPQENGSWLALWKGRSRIPYTDTDLFYKSPFRSDSDQGKLSLPDAGLIMGNLYTLALFMSGWNDGGENISQLAVAATVTFFVT